MAGRVSRVRRPAVINDDVFVTKVLEAERDEFVGCVKSVFGGGSVTLASILVIFSKYMATEVIMAKDLPSYSIPKRA